jgi:hypothetical protein
MPTQGQRQNFQWRPNDNSSTTKLRYQLEAEHWVNAIKSTTSKTTATLSETLGVIGLCISFIINLISLVVLLLTLIVKWLVGINAPPKKTKYEKWCEDNNIYKREGNTSFEKLSEWRKTGNIEIMDGYED